MDDFPDVNFILGQHLAIPSITDEHTRFLPHSEDSNDVEMEIPFDDSIFEDNIA